VVIITDKTIVRKGAILGILIGAFLFFTNSASATTLDPISFSPTTQDVGSYAPGSVTVSNGGATYQNCMYWFDGGGNALSSHTLACGTGYPSLPTTLNNLDPNSLITDVVGSWTLILGVAAGNSGSGACATGGGNLASCEAYFAGGSYTYYGEGNFQIVTPGGGGSSSTATSSVDQVQENLFNMWIVFFGTFISTVWLLRKTS